jgi:hypothetical protein
MTATVAAIDELLKGAVDSHVHSFPDVIDRKVDDLTLVEQARVAGIGGLVLKCHHGSTVERAWLLNRIQGEVRVIGGIVLNHAVGGLNPRAVEAALKMGATQVWMPTKSAANHQRHLGGSDGICILNDGRLLPVVADILRQIADADAVLATGHLSPEESRALVLEALAAGVRRISITHPEWGVTAIPVNVQQELAAAGGVYFERCLVSIQPDIPQRVEFDAIVLQIRAVGVRTTIAATDYGMPQYDTPANGMRQFIARLIAAGFDAAEVRQMTRDNPRRLLKLTDAEGTPK